MRRVTALAAAIVAAVTVLAGCTPETDAAPPDGLRVAVYQPRTDIALDRIALEMRNDSGEEVTIVSAQLESSFFTGPLVWQPDRDVVMPRGRKVDLRVDLGEADCSSRDGVQRVRLGYRIGEGPETEVVLEPELRFGSLEAIHTAACLRERVIAVATITSAGMISSGMPGAPATLLLQIEPTGADGEVTIDSVASTTLLLPTADGTGEQEVPLDVTVDADGPTSIEIPMVTNRCDVHALAEDKVGTLIPLTVTTPDGTTGRLVLPASDDFRSQVYAFFTSSCGLG